MDEDEDEDDEADDDDDDDDDEADDKEEDDEEEVPPCVESEEEEEEALDDELFPRVESQRVSVGDARRGLVCVRGSARAVDGGLAQDGAAATAAHVAAALRDASEALARSGGALVLFLPKTRKTRILSLSLSLSLEPLCLCRP